MTQPVVRRPNLPLTAKDEADLTLVRTSVSFRRALAQLASSAPSIDGELGEAVLLHAVFEAGIAAVRKSAEDEGYAQLAAEYAEHAEARRGMSRRRLPMWADES